MNISTIRIKNKLNFLNYHINYIFHLNPPCCFLVNDWNIQGKAPCCAYDLFEDYVLMNINWEAKNKILRRSTSPYLWKSEETENLCSVLSPDIVSCAKLAQIGCFKKNEECFDPNNRTKKKRESFVGLVTIHFDFTNGRKSTYATS